MATARPRAFFSTKNLEADLGKLLKVDLMYKTKAYSTLL
jgi:hypothetical protein